MNKTNEKTKSMKYNRGYLTARFCVVFTSCFILTGAFSTARSISAQSPNFIIIFTDDQRADELGPSGPYPWLNTPNIDQLSKRGVTFKNAFVPTPMCVTSRASLYSGQYTRNNRVHGFSQEFPEDVLEICYPYLLKNAGYKTGCLGKFHIQTNEETLKMFDYWNAATHTNWQYDKRDVKKKHETESADKTITQTEWFYEVDGKKKHETEWLADQAITFFKKYGDSPFCLTINYMSPHWPFTPDERDEQLFSDVTILRHPLDQTRYFEALPDTVKNSFSRGCYNSVCSLEEYQESIRQYARCLVSIDRSVGRILNYLVKSGLDRNTVIFFLSDNGNGFGERQLSGKWLLFEESIRVPFIVYDPRLPPDQTNKTCEEMVLNIDVAPTILEMAGIAIPEKMDGYSISGLLSGQQIDWRDHFLMEHYYPHQPSKPMGHIPRSQGIRTKEWKYIRYIDPEPNIEAMYNLSIDPYEINDLSKNTEYKGALQMLRTKLNSINQNNPNTYPFPED